MHLNHSMILWSNNKCKDSKESEDLALLKEEEYNHIWNFHIINQNLQREKRLKC